MSRSPRESKARRSAGHRPPELRLETRYKALRIVAAIYRLLGWLTVVFTFLVGGLFTWMVLIDHKPLEGVPQLSRELWGGMALGVWFYGSVLALMLFFAGESIRLGIDVEEDIRMNSRILRRIELLLARSPEDMAQPSADHE